jgi:hypothetical protein
MLDIWRVSWGISRILPSSPEEWMIVSPRRVFRPIKLQTRRAYFSGTVYRAVSSGSANRILDVSYLLIITIGVGDHLRNLRVLLREQVLVVDQIRLVLVVRCSRLIGIGDERAKDNISKHPSDLQDEVDTYATPPVMNS